MTCNPAKSTCATCAAMSANPRARQRFGWRSRTGEQKQSSICALAALKTVILKANGLGWKAGDHDQL